MRSLPARLLACLGIFTIAACSQSVPTLGDALPPGSARGFNVLLVTLDTTRADRLGCYGYASAKTPALDGLAAKGLCFTKAVTCVPMTTPSHASILTGLYPPNHGVRNNGELPLSDERTTLAEILREHGYQTAAFVSAFVLDSRYGLAQGFESYDQELEVTQGANSFGRDNERLGAKTTDAFVAWLAARDAARPFFAWVHYYDPHDPYSPPPPFDAQFKERPYDGEIAYVDSQVDRVLNALAIRGLRDRTLVVVTSDHGESLGEHRESTHAHTIYDAAMRVPLILACPQAILSPRMVSDRVASTVDIFPTVLDVLGIAAPGPVDGLSLIGPPPPAERAVYLETLATLLNNGWAPLFALRRADDKLIRAPQSEYFDLAKDPHETSNALSSRPDAAKELGAQLDVLLAKWPSDVAALFSAKSQDAEEIARLRALGYAGGLADASALGVLDPKDMLPVWELVLESKAQLSNARGPRAAEMLSKARQSVERALALSPRDRGALEQLAMVATVDGKLDEAEQALRKFIEIRPTADALVFLAQVLVRAGRVQDVDALLDAAAVFEPAHGGIRVARGDKLLAEGKIEEAIAQYEEAARVDPYRARGMATARIAAARARQPGR